METRKKQAPKGTYHRPEVRDYGNLSTITKTGTTGAADTTMGGKS
jgi:hypothetical protein